MLLYFVIAIRTFLSNSDCARYKEGMRAGEESTSAEQHLLKLLEEKQVKKECCIVYCHKRETCEEIAHLLQHHHNSISCEVYHAGIGSAERQRIVIDFMNKKNHIIAATVAFGMGIDRDDVRLVVHWNVPKNVESFYQESGRAGMYIPSVRAIPLSCVNLSKDIASAVGRDGKPAHSLVYYSSTEAHKMEYLLLKEDEA